jgi:H+-transporting ATPase
LILFIAATIALGISTILGCLWPKGQIDGVQVQGLNVHDDNDGFDEYNLWPLWVWIYCVVFFFVQDLLKVIFYWIMLKFDIFEARTGALVNVRGYTSPGQSETAAEATGRVEKKLLGRKIDATISGIQSLVNRKMSGKAPPSLARVSQTLATARTSISPLDRPSPTPLPENTIKDIKAATADVEGYLDDEDRKALNQQIEEVERVAGNLQRVSAVLKEDPGKRS